MIAWSVDSSFGAMEPMAYAVQVHASSGISETSVHRSVRPSSRADLSMLRPESFPPPPPVPRNKQPRTKSSQSSIEVNSYVDTLPLHWLCLAGAQTGGPLATSKLISQRPGSCQELCNPGSTA